VSEEVSDDPLTRLTRGIIKSCAGTGEKDQVSYILLSSRYVVRTFVLFLKVL